MFWQIFLSTCSKLTERTVEISNYNCRIVYFFFQLFHFLVIVFCSSAVRYVHIQDYHILVNWPFCHCVMFLFIPGNILCSELCFVWYEYSHCGFLLISIRLSIFLYPFSINQLISLHLKWLSSTELIIGSCLLSILTVSYLVFKQYTFNVITDIFSFSSAIYFLLSPLFLLYLLFCFLLDDLNILIFHFNLRSGFWLFFFVYFRQLLLDYIIYTFCSLLRVSVVPLQ